MQCLACAMEALNAAKSLEEQIVIARMIARPPAPRPDATTWEDASRGLGRNDMPEALWGGFSERRLVGQELITGITRAWTMAEWPAQTLGTDAWQILWQGAVELDTEYIHDGVARSRTILPETIRLYRGAHPSYACGMSWTDDREQAEWFRDRFGGEGMNLYRVDASRDDVLGRFEESRGEREWVLSVNGLEPQRAD